MKLAHDIHLGYCTNIHRGESWAETFAGLRDYTWKVKDRVSPDRPYGIGLRLGREAAVGLSQPSEMDGFRRWLDAENCYVFTINGFPYGQFHGTRVKEDVYRPDWTTRERLDYTNLLFDILARLLPDGQSGSVSTLPGSFKEFGIGKSGLHKIFDNLVACRDHIRALSERTGHDLHLGLEPEPLGLFETSRETLEFFGHLVDQKRGDGEILRYIGVNYDTCHLAVEFEGANDALGTLRKAGIRISKLHLSSALRVKPTPEALLRLSDFQDDVYLHQVILKDGENPLLRFRDLPDAFAFAASHPESVGDEWRIHFHIPLHSAPEDPFGDTRDHIEDTLDLLKSDPSLCSHLEMETYTWEVLPAPMRAMNVVDQLANEYAWTLAALKSRDLLAH